MKDCLLKVKREYVLTGIGVLVVLVAAMLICPPYYAMNDDTMMKSILSGAYTGTPDGHAVYMKYPLTGILSLLYHITDRIPWFDVFMVGCFWGALSAVMIRSFTMFGKQSEQRKGSAVCMVTGMSALCFALFLPQLLSLHYTVVAAMVGGSGVFLFMTGGGVVSVVLLTLCYCIRSQVFFLLLPFLLVAVLWNGLDKKIKPLLKWVLATVVCVVVCMALNSIMYRSADWKYYAEYNDSRTQLYDYNQLLPYEEHSQAFEMAGISAMEHRLLEEYVLVLAENITPETMDVAAEMTVSWRNERQTEMEYLIHCIKEYYYHIRYNGQPYNYIFVGGCVFGIALLLLRKQWLKLGLMGCFLAGRSMIWLFLIWQGRFPERVYVALYVVEIMLLAGMIFSCVRQWEGISLKKEFIGKRSIGSVLVCGVLCAALLGASGVACAEKWNRANVQAKEHREWLALTEYCQRNPETTYLLDVYSMVSYSGKVGDVNTQKENFLLTGGWLMASPLMKERLDEIVLENCRYIIAVDRDVEWLYEFCQERFTGLRLEKMDNISLDGIKLFDVYGLVTE